MALRSADTEPTLYRLQKRMDLMEEMIEQLQADREEEEQPTAAVQPKERQVIQPLHDLSLSSLGGYIVMCVFRFAVYA